MSALTIELCPETGICSLVKPEIKADLLSTEVADIHGAAGNLQKIRQIIAEADDKFAASLDETELQQIAQRLSS